MAGKAKFWIVGICVRDHGFYISEDGRVRKFDTCVATSSRSKKDRDSTDFHNVIAYGEKADILNELCKKGTKMACDGNIKYRTGKDGIKHTDLEIDWFEVY